jgi:hypothetical protein
MTDNPNNHPSSMSDADKQALRESDPAAFDDETQPPAGDAPNEAAGDATNAGADGSEAADGSGDGTDAGQGDEAQDAGDPAAKAGTGKAPPAVVPKDRLDEVIDQRNQAERLSTQQAVELEQLRARLAELEAPKDYEAEYLAIEAKYDAGDMDEAQRAAAIRQVAREEQQFIARRAALQTQHEVLESAVQKSWDEEVAAFAARNKGFLDVDTNVEVFQRALNATAAFYGNTISQAELLNKAAKQAFEFTGYQPPGGAPEPAAGAADKAAARRAQNAARATDAASTPPQITGGVGERGGPARGVDLEHLKPGTFSQKLSKEEQEKLLGPGAV